MNYRVPVLVICAVLPLAHLHAQSPAGSSLRVFARVRAACAITASQIAAAAVGAQAGGAGTILLKATCTPNATYRIRLSAGATPGAATLTNLGTGQPQDQTVPAPVSRELASPGTGGVITVGVFY